MVLHDDDMIYIYIYIYIYIMFVTIFMMYVH
jgi:hypothetical protein